MKKNMVFVWISVLCIALLGCGKTNDDYSTSQEIKLSDDAERNEQVLDECVEMQQNVGGDEIELEINVAEEVSEDSYNTDNESIFDFGDMNPIYIDYLSNKIRIANPYNVEPPLSIIFYKEYYDGALDDAKVEYALLDMNNDEEEELIVYVHKELSELLDIYSISDDEIIWIDGFETHTNKMGALVYDNAVISYGENYDDYITDIYSYNLDGSKNYIISFYKDSNSSSELSFDYYYLDGNLNNKIMLASDDEFEALYFQYVGKTLEYNDITEYVESLSR